MNSLNSFRKLVSNKSFGIEIECFIDIEGAKRLPECCHSGFFYVTTDMSLSVRDYWTTHRFSREFVSQPLPADWLHKEIWKLWKKSGGWETDDSCGTHVHVNRKWCPLAKAKAIYNAIKKLSDEQFKEIFGRYINKFCRVDVSIGETRYAAVNVENVATIEFRMFAGGNAQWACYCVSMAKFMVENYNTLNYEQLLAARDMFLKNY